MKRIYFIFFAVLVVVTFITGCNTNKARIVQYNYSYSCQSNSWNDISRLYSADTSRVAVPFMKRSSLRHIQSQFSCTVRKTVLENNSDTALIAFEIIDPQLKLLSNNAIINSDEITSSLTAYPFYAVARSNGYVSGISIDTAVHPAAAGIMKSIAGYQQFVNNNPGDSLWVVNEENANGLYSAQYAKLAGSASANHYKKVNTGYLQLKTKMKNSRMSVINESVFSVDTSGILVKAAGTENETLVVASDTINMASLRVQFALQGTTMADATVVRDLLPARHSVANNGFTGLSAPMSQHTINLLTYKNTLGADTWNSLLEKLDDISLLPDEAADTLMLKFRALAYIKPATCEKVAALLKDETFGTARYTLLSKVLANTGTEDAANAMAAVAVYRKGDENVLLDLLPSIAVSPNPSKNATGLMINFSADTTLDPNIRYTAQLALGGIVHNMYSSNKEEADKIADYICNINFGKDTVQQLLVLGNAGSVKGLPVIEKILVSATASEEIKCKAVDALRFINSAEAEKTLAGLQAGKSKALSKTAQEVALYRTAYFEERANNLP